MNIAQSNIVEKAELYDTSELSGIQLPKNIIKRKRFKLENCAFKFLSISYYSSEIHGRRN